MVMVSGSTTLRVIGLLHEPEVKVMVAPADTVMALPERTGPFTVRAVAEPRSSEILPVTVPVPISVTAEPAKADWVREAATVWPAVTFTTTAKLLLTTEPTKTPLSRDTMPLAVALN